MMNGITVTTKNIDSIFKSVYEKAKEFADETARRAYLVMDFEQYWLMTEEGSDAYIEAVKLNTRGERVLSVDDRRTRGYRYYSKKKREAWLDYQERYGA